MSKTMLIDATHPEETRVAVVDGRKLEEFDVEIASRRPLKGNIYLAKVTRVEPSLQAAFVEYGGNRHGFLALSEIHPDYYRIPVADREALLRAVAEDHDEADGDLEDHDIEVAEDEREVAATVVLENGTEAAAQDSDLVDEAQSELSPAENEAPSGARIIEALAEDLPDQKPKTESPTTEDAPSDETMVAPWEEPASSAIPLETPRFELRGERIEEPTGAVETTAAQSAEEPAVAADLLVGGENDLIEPAAQVRSIESDLPAPEKGEVIEVPTSREVIDVSGHEEPAAQDDPEVEAERARHRRMKNLRRYKIQEVIKRRQILLVQVTKEERGNKGAALTTYLSLAGRYCVLMPNTDRGGGISRRITNATDRKRLKSIIDDLDAPEGMAVIVRTAGMERSKPEIRRDFDYLLRLWDEIRETTLQSTAPALIYEEASLIKRSIRDLYTRDIGDIVVAGDEAYKAARAFMRTLTPSHIKRIQHYRDHSVPLFQRYQVESQIAAIHEPIVQLRSGGYIVINQTEALVAIDVNSGRATRERNIEETALRTNLEAADEIARQLRLRDLAGLIVIDFIDMEESRNNAAVERRIKEALKNDRARIQIGRISTFGLLEMSRQRLHPSLVEASTEVCQHCHGAGRVRSVDSTALHVLRMVEEEITRQHSPGVTVYVPEGVGLFILNQKRTALAELEMRRGVRIYIQSDDELTPPNYRLDRIRQLAPGEEVVQRSTAPKPIEIDFPEEAELEAEELEEIEAEAEAAEASTEAAEEASEGRHGRKRRRRRGRGGKFRADEFTETSETQPAPMAAAPDEPAEAVVTEVESDDEADEAEGEREEVAADGEKEGSRRRRRRGRRGGRRRSRRQDGTPEIGAEASDRAGDQAPEVPGLGDQPSLPEEMPSHWQERVAQTAVAAEAQTEAPVAGDLPIEVAVEAEEVQQPKRRTRRPRKREETNGDGGAETAVTETAAIERPIAVPEAAEIAATPTETARSSGVHVIEVGPHGERQELPTPAAEGKSKRGWWRRLIE